jgi:hypothetical protein
VSEKGKKYISRHKFQIKRQLIKGFQFYFMCMFEGQQKRVRVTAALNVNNESCYMQKYAKIKRAFV